MGQVGRGLAITLAITLATPAQAARSFEPATMPTPVADSTPPTTATTATTAILAPTSITDQSEAIRRFRAARDLYTAEAYADAARGFESSYAAAPSPEAAYNAALAHDKIGADLSAMIWFQRYLAVASRDDASHPWALQRVEELRARLGELDLQLDSPDEIRQLSLNGEEVTLADFPRLVTPGRIELRLVGDAPEQVADILAEVAPGGTWTIHFPGFARAPEPSAQVPLGRPVTPEVVPLAPRNGRPLLALFWTATGLTAVSGVATGVLGGLTLRAWNDYPACGQRLDCAASREPFHRTKDATNVMIGVTTGLAVITLALGLAALRERRKARRGRPDGRLRVTLAGVQLAF